MQFVTIYLLLKHGRPIIDHKSMKELYDFLQFPKSPQHHYNDTSVWTMAECMQELVLIKTHLVVQSTKFIFVSIDEIITMHYQRWIIIHVYVVEGWKCIPILLTLEQVLLNVIANNLIKVIMRSLLQYGSLLI